VSEIKGKICEGIGETIGNTPLVRTVRLAKEEGLEADLLLKLEFFNPMASRRPGEGRAPPGGLGGRRADLG
jgi:hypothetical protein